MDNINEDAKEYDYVNPSHYKEGYKEVQDMMIDVFGKQNYMMFCYMNAFKYRMRLGKKPGQGLELELDKVRWYENRAAELSAEKNSLKEHIEQMKASIHTPITGNRAIGMGYDGEKIEVNKKDK
ncbi:MAG: DUF3310 domain-containing protein [Firmicutes bacterium]|jgi:hypothetical protein|nr:DUF3310 domain-containing protein [Bacillota bacterium]